MRPLDVNTLLGDAKEARKILKWKPEKDINFLIQEMIEAEYKLLNGQIKKVEYSLQVIRGWLAPQFYVISKKGYKNLFLKRSSLNLLDQKNI